MKTCKELLYGGACCGGKTAIMMKFVKALYPDCTIYVPTQERCDSLKKAYPWAKIKVMSKH